MIQLSSRINHNKMFVSRGGEKLESAIEHWKDKLDDMVCADFGSSTGGFVDCMLCNGAKKVYAVETGYGILDYKLRKDSRVVAMERTNALHAVFPERIDFISIDVGWTRQEKILPHAIECISDRGIIYSLLKPQYEVEKNVKFVKGKKSIANPLEIMKDVMIKIMDLGIKPIDIYPCPVKGMKGNTEYWLKIAK